MIFFNDLKKSCVWPKCKEGNKYFIKKIEKKCIEISFYAYICRLKE